MDAWIMEIFQLQQPSLIWFNIEFLVQIKIYMYSKIE